MIWLALVVFPAASLANQARTMVKLPGQLPFCVFSKKFSDGFGSQLSTTVTLAGGGTEPHCTVVLAGSPTKDGRVESFTVMFWV
jgi:hypothetical protein